jgi:hypothetical protein
MSLEPTRERRGLAYAAAILGSFLIVAVMVLAMRHYSQPSPLGAERAAKRARDLAELRASESEVLNNAAWINPSNGIVRLRIEDSMRLVEKEWANPSLARSNLISRVEKANPPPPKPAPSPFE